MKRKKILHFIHDLGRGGAETILVTTLRELEEYDNIVVTLNGRNDFNGKLNCSAYINLDIRGLLFFPFYALKLRRIIKQHGIDIVHSRLFWPNIIARLGTPKNVPLVTTIHAYIADSFEYKKWYIRALDKISWKWHKTILLGDSQGVIDQYLDFLKLKPYKFISPYTFVDTSVFISRELKTMDGPVVRLISTGRLSMQKNYIYLIEAFRYLKDIPVELHIYGRPVLKNDLQPLIDEYGVKVFLKGQSDELNAIIPDYDIFTMSSLYEGFSLSVLEAMAMGMPLLLSDIPSFREQCADTAVYFNLDDPKDFAVKLMPLIADRQVRNELGQKAKERVLNNFTLEHHMTIMRKVYEEALAPDKTPE